MTQQTPETVTLAFYKGEGRFYDRLIRWWTKSDYSHVELVAEKEDRIFIGWSSSPRDGGVRAKFIKIQPRHWDFIDVPIKNQQWVFANARALRDLGYRYDWINIFFSQILPFKLQIRNRMICSEFVAECLGFDTPEKHTPQSLYALVTS
ncbi:MAG: hypothetical protein ACPGVK_08290 [Halocynthiibacter sp.]